MTYQENDLAIARMSHWNRIVSGGCPNCNSKKIDKNGDDCNCVIFLRKIVPYILANLPDKLLNDEFLLYSRQNTSLDNDVKLTSTLQQVDKIYKQSEELRRELLNKLQENVNFILLYGAGPGKTTILTKLCQELIDINHSSYYAIADDIVDYNSPLKVPFYFFKTVKTLFIDNFGTHDFGTQGQRQSGIMFKIDSLLSYRRDNCLSTIISSRFTRQQLETIYNEHIAQMLDTGISKKIGK